MKFIDKFVLIYSFFAFVNTNKKKGHNNGL